MKKRLLVLIPYRDRANQLNLFIPHIEKTLNKQQIEYKIVVVEQNNQLPFNKGLLLNIGFFLFYKQYEYVCFHDVDIFGDNFDFNYKNYVVHFTDGNNYLGGVVLFPNETFIKVNGYSNNYNGWGCEDNDLWLRCITHSIKIDNSKYSYQQLSHSRNVNRKLYYKNYDLLISRYRTSFIQRKEMFQKDGLLDLTNTNLDCNIISNKKYILLKVN